MTLSKGLQMEHFEQSHQLNRDRSMMICFFLAGMLDPGSQVLLMTTMMMCSGILFNKLWHHIGSKCCTAGGHLLTPPKTWQTSPSRRAPPHPAGSVFLLEIGPSSPLPPHQSSTLLGILLSKSFLSWCLPSELQLLPRNLSQPLLPPLHLAIRSSVKRRP